MTDKDQALALTIGQLYLRGRYDAQTNRTITQFASDTERFIYNFGRSHEMGGVPLPVAAPGSFEP